MGVTIPEAGKRYRVSREFEIDTASGEWAFSSDGMGFVVEKWEWEELEPEYEEGCYYIDAEGDVYRRSAHSRGDWPWRGGSTNWGWDVPVRPLRKLELP